MIEENWDDLDSLNTTPNTYGHQNETLRTKEFSTHETEDRYEKGCGKNNIWRSRSNYKEKNYDNFNDLIMRVEGTKVGMIIGRNGTKIRELSNISGAKIKIGNRCIDDDYMTEIILSGDKSSRELCESLINDLVKNNYSIKSFPNGRLSEREPVPLIDWDAANKRSIEAEAKKWSSCPPLKKNFYIEDSSIAQMNAEEVEKFRMEKNNIVVSCVFGSEEKILNPVQTFAQAFQHYPEILKEIEKQGFETPSPIQCQAWPILLSGKDLIGIAQTGTGKTLAFLLPALIHINGQDIPRAERGGANVLILAPTRELALQIENEVRKYSYKDIKCVCVYGGGSRNEQIKTLGKGIEIIIATPGRLNDLVETGFINLTSITYLVLDEADRMLDMGFEPQIRKVLLDIRPDKQAVMTSATWPPAVQSLAERYMNNPIQVYIGSLDLAAVHSITQTVLVINEEEKREQLVNLIRNLKEEDKIIIFVGRKVTADDLSCDFALDQIICQCIHGNREQSDREQALDDLKTGLVKILIATDVASRGLDICDITKVVNYDFPKNIEEYVHRVGRTGRAGKTGEAITFFTRADWAYAEDLISIMEKADQVVPEELYEMRDRFLRKQRQQEERMPDSFGGNKKGSRYSRGYSYKWN